MTPELMSPAGNREAFFAAADNGADAVYLGLNMFNARRPARNFRFEDISEIISYAHSRSVKVYITLNTDLKSSELEDAARILQFLISVKADAVIIKDLALVYMLNNFYPPFEFHFSTQTGIANSAAMAVAEKLGASRVVLARELNSDELKAVIKPYFPRAEVFVQGSMCFSFSGRCLMSSWFGGKSANRGSCQAPCRFKFAPEDSDDFTAFFSMKDLNLSKRLEELNNAGVSAFKIEGRLKSAQWVGEVTRFYRSMINNAGPGGADPSKFTGREQGEGFYAELNDMITSKNSIGVSTGIKTKSPDRKNGLNTYDITVWAGGLVKIGIETDFGNADYQAKIKKLVNPKRGILLSQLEYKLRGLSFGNLFLGSFKLDNDILISKSQLKNIVSDLGSIIAPLTRKETKFLKSVKTPHKLEYELKNRMSDPKNSIEVSFQNANVLKINASDIEQIRPDIRDSGIKKVIVREITPAHLEQIKDLSNKVRVEISLFPILFENDLQDCRIIISALEHTNNISYEINDIGHLELLKKTSKKIDGGPGLAPYNFLAAKQLKELGLASAHIPYESDIELLDGLKYSPLPLRMTVYGKIPLFYTRASSFAFPEKSLFRDRENFKFSVSRYKDISIFSSEDYFSAYGQDIGFLKVHEIIIDLSNETGILYKFGMIKKDPSKFPGLLFNLNRKLT